MKEYVACFGLVNNVVAITLAFYTVRDWLLDEGVPQSNADQIVRELGHLDVGEFVTLTLLSEDNLRNVVVFRSK